MSESNQNEISTNSDVFISNIEIIFPKPQKVPILGLKLDYKNIRRYATSELRRILKLPKLSPQDKNIIKKELKNRKRIK